ncbi:hypothetical protein Slin15195_G061520 [Septoria linicola]|uniref:DUF6590 domain-containing protein n=1 Tax=Septoria linicola TaxID=215465 RepID=A0A9Q9EKX9_9PEZI|nr:hypothetical protein Slin14017_G077320 [Septoria linicola]USW52833.1 hypothetical protein Slin15195_G061520 [Septoria linicola]
MATRQDASNVRLQVQIQQQNIINELSYFRESREAFMQAIASEMDGSRDHAILAQKHDQLREDEDRLENSLRLYSTLTVTLSRLDMDILNEDEKHQNPHGTNLLAKVPTMAPSTVLNLRKIAKDDINDGMDPLLLEYFDLLGDIRLLHERLEEEIPYEHAEKKAHREMLVDQDLGSSEAGVSFSSARNVHREDSAMSSVEDSYCDVVGVVSEVHETASDKAFAAECRDEIDRVKAILSEKERLASDLRQRCIDKGINPDPNRWKRASETASTQGGTGDPTEGDIQHWLQNVQESSEHTDDDIAILEPSDLSLNVMYRGTVSGHPYKGDPAERDSERFNDPDDSRDSNDTDQPFGEAVPNIEPQKDSVNSRSAADDRRGPETTSLLRHTSLSDPIQSYWNVGRVFWMTTSWVAHSDRATRRLLVIVECQQDLCLTLGVANRRNKSDYVIVFSGPEPPELLEAERAARSELSVRYPAIRIVASQPGTYLPEHARLYLGDERRITYDTPYEDFGSVHEHSLAALKTHHEVVRGLKQQMKLGVSQINNSTSPARHIAAGDGALP